ncbi:MAG: HEAT repeat domain-containing protein [Planctomycetes bacterium]|nr:HEAT repeat domain-containing protein [Planctomycetota bacterium]
MYQKLLLIITLIGIIRSESVLNFINKDDEANKQIDIQSLIEQVNNNDIEVRTLALKQLTKCWKDSHSVKIIISQLKKATLNNNAQLARTLSTVISEIQDKRTSKLMHLLNSLLKDTTFNPTNSIKDVQNFIDYVDERTLLEYFETWLIDETKLKEPLIPRQEWFTGFIYPILQHPESKTKFADWIGRNIRFNKNTVAQLFTDINPIVRKHVVETMGVIFFLASGTNHDQLKGLVNTDPKTKVIAKEKADAFKSYVVKALGDADSEVRSTASKSLSYDVGIINTDDSIATLLLDHDPKVREATIYTLRMRDATKYSDKIIKFLDDDSASVQIQAIYTIRDFKHLVAGSKLMTIINDSARSLTVRSTAIRAIGILGLQEFSTELSKFLKHNDKALSAATACAIGDLKETAYKEEIADLLLENDSVIQRSALYALRKMGASDYSNKISELLNIYNDSDSLLAVIYTLRKLNAKEFASNIAIFLKHSNIAIIIEAIQTLRDFSAIEYADEIAKHAFNCDEITILGTASPTDSYRTTPRQEVLKTLKEWGIDTIKHEKGYEHLDIRY